MNNKKRWAKLALILVLIITVAAAFVPTAYYVEMPGSTIDLKELITVNNEQDKEDGSFSLTSVGIQRATVFRLIRAQFSSFEEIVSQEELMGGSTSTQYNQMQEYYMESSQNAAIQQALELAEKDYQIDYKGVYVLGVDENSAFVNQIAIGDTVTKADGQSFASSQAFMEYVQSQEVGQEMTVTYIHDDQEQEATGQLMELPSNQKPGIGITLTDHTEVTTDEVINFDVENIGGPSAGLMFTLEIYAQLVQDDIRKGHEIAGTGTIDNEGNIGRIGGIDKKVASATQAGAEIFFAPDDEVASDSGEQSNYQEAKAAAKELGSQLEIVPVKTVQDALDYLEQLN